MINDENSTAQLRPIAYRPQGLDYALVFFELPGFVWLDSGTERAYGGRYDILSALPCATLSMPSPGKLELDGVAVTLDIDAWINTQQLHLSPCCQVPLPFCGGIIGYVSYAYRHNEYGINPKHADSLPLLQLGAYAWTLIQDHETQTAWLYFTPNCPAAITRQITQLLDPWLESSLSGKSTAPLNQNFSCGPFNPLTLKSAYLQKVERILTYIRAGDTYQVNLSQQFSATFEGSSFAAYSALRDVSSSPFGAYLKTATGAILSLSPEQFIGIEGKRASTRPIKGTAARSSVDTIDFALAQELLNSEKNRAENLMIVDLLRNDFSQNCEPFSVKTEELFSLKTYANVHHLVSWVQGRLKANVTPWQFFTACFPGGSITGAPKKRAMEIIDELEDGSRNIYCGAIGYWSANGNMDTNIAIRTLLIERNTIYVWGGGGIVADSTAEAEYAETLQKIALLQQTLTQHSLTHKTPC